MTRLIVLLLLLVAAPAFAADPAAEARYQTLLTAAKSGAGPVDWQALRLAFADTPEYGALGAFAGGGEAMFKAFNAHDDKGALAQAQAIIDQDYVDIDAHQISSLAYKRLGDAASAQREHDIAWGLISSINTGDGATQQTALTVITVREEYIILSVRGLKPARQSLIHSGGHSYDELDATGAGGKTVSIYFQIDRITAAERAMFEKH